MRLHQGVLLAGVALLSMSQAAQAALIVNIQEIGSDVVTTGTGTLDLTGLVNEGRGILSTGIRSKYAFFGAGNSNFVTGYSGISGPASFGTGYAYFDTTSVGDMFGFNIEFSTVFVTEGYSSGDPINFTSSYANSSFASLGLTQGAYTYRLPEDRFTLVIGTVPLPASAPMFGVALVALGGLGYAAKRKNVAAAT